jgi:hypothetical protein
MSKEDNYLAEPSEVAPDLKELEARKELAEFLDKNRKKVFYSRRLEVMYEDKYFHWVTNRALASLINDGLIKFELRKLKYGGSIKLLWHRSYRYYKTSAKNIVNLVEEYSTPSMTEAIGYQGESLVAGGFARFQFVMEGQNTRKFQGKEWNETEHDLDYMFGRDSLYYGVEVKNTLGYIDYEEFKIKIRLCEHLGVRPVFVVRMMPRVWIEELREKGGFTLVLKYQFYPLNSRELANRVRNELGLPVDTPKALEDGTMQRFVKWHEKNL